MQRLDDAEAGVGSGPGSGRRLLGERHVVVARARDYRDVVPLKGIYSGAPSSTFTVDVALTRRA